MAEDLTPKIVQKYDSAELQPGGTARPTTVVRFMLGRFGPFEKVFDRGPGKFEIETEMRARASSLEGLA